MGVITAGNLNSFKSAEFIFAKIKRQWESFDSVNILDDSEFAGYTAEVLKRLGIGAFKEDVALLKVKGRKADLPKDFRAFHAAYKCFDFNTKVPKRHLQGTPSYFENDITCNVLKRAKNCEINCECPDRIIETITIKTYVNEHPEVSTYNKTCLLKLSPNAIAHCMEGSPNIHQSGTDEITINNKQVFTNFDDGDIFIEYYAMPLDENNIPMIPDNEAVERAVEWYIKWQVLLNYWLVDELPNAQTKWGKAEAEYEKNMATAKFLNKLPSFATMVNSLRTARSINKLAHFGRNNTY